MSNATSLWVRAIGSPSEQSGHGLQFKSYEQHGKPPYCRKDDGTWNVIYSESSVVIDTLNERGEGRYALSYAPYGYRSHDFDQDPGRQNLRINYAEMMNARNPTTLVAHELGELVLFAALSHWLTI